MRTSLILLSLIYFCLPYSYAGQKYEIFKTKLNENLELLSTYPKTIFDEELISFDPDSLSGVIAMEIISFLSSDDSTYFRQEDFPLLENTTDSTNGTFFEVLIFGYHCGGTAGWIPKPITIKQTHGKTKIFNMIDTDCYFYDFYHLSEEKYLCIGSVPGWGSCRNEAIYVIDFKKDIPEFEPAFSNKAIFSICNSSIEYEEINRIVTIEVEYLPSDNDCKSFFQDPDYSCFLIECNPDSDDNEDTVAILTTKYDGNKFIKPDYTD